MTPSQRSLSTLKHIYRALRAEVALQRTLSARACHSTVQETGVVLDRGYLVTTNTGVYRLAGGTIYRVFRHKTYGIAMDTDHAYLSVHADRYAMVVRCNRAALLGHSPSLDLRVLHCQATRDMRDRMHGLSLGPAGLWVANTCRNTLLHLDTVTGRVLDEIAPFRDTFGTPLFYNVNHINSVCARDGYVLFVANRAGDQSLVAVLEGDRVTAYGYRNIGVHDLYPTRDGFLFCDTFGPAGAENLGGSLVGESGEFDGAYFRSRTLTVRGLAGDPGDELLIGNSHRGQRETRSSGHGSILVARGGRVVDEIRLRHSAQVYQIVQEDGQFVGGAGPTITAATIRERLGGLLGPPVLDDRLQPAGYWVRFTWRQSQPDCAS